MSNQIQITGGAKVRSLEGVITGTTGVLSSLPINGSGGIPQLDVNGKILVSQLPNSVMEYKGTWDASTNTPTLANGTGNQGDVYLCNAAGTVNFGAGGITFAVGDQVIYSGTIWQKAGGATGTVTSVAVTESGDALTITGSPITTSGTINIGFAGTSAQYVAGDGSLITFPSIVTEAQNLITEVYNETGATLTKGTVVYINGGHGNLPTITKALATSDATSAQTYGVVQTDITNNNNGYVVAIGRLTNIDTQAYAAGTQLYLSSTTAGAWTSTKQYAPAHLVYVGIVVRSHPTQGVVEVKIQNGYELDELHNVSAQTPSNNDGLFYNSSNSLWENKSIATALGYTPQAQLNGTGFIKASGTTISYDNSTYLTTSSAASTYVPYNGATMAVDITGNNFSSSNIKINGDNTSNFGFLGFKQFSGGSSGFSGYTSIYAQGTNKINIAFSSTGSNKTISFLSDLISSNTTREYSFPDASGTIALTSNLSSYLPLSGGTLTGALNGTSATFSTQLKVSNSTGTALDMLVLETAFSNPSGNKSIIWKDATNNLGRISVSYDASTGSTMRFGSLYNGGYQSSDLLTIASTGAATFSSSVKVGAGLNVTGYTNSSSGNYWEIGSDASGYYMNALNRSSGNYNLPAYIDAQKLIINSGSGGNVGIGTSSPSAKLEVSGGSILTNSSFVVRSGSYTLETGITGSGSYIQSYVTSGVGSADLYFYTGTSERMRITSGGNVLIGGTTGAAVKLGVFGASNTSSSYSFVAWNASGNDLLSVRGDGLVTFPTVVSTWTTGNAANAWLNPSSGDLYRSTSSIKYKKNVQNYTKGLAEVMQLRPVSYEGKHEVDNGKTFAGLIAEEVHDLGLTEFVQYAEDGTPDALAYGNMVSLLIKAIQEQQAEIDELKNK